VLVLAAMVCEEVSRLLLLRRAAGRIAAAVWLPPLALLWILNWARLATLLRFA
jgi:hypothetical protein